MRRSSRLAGACPQGSTRIALVVMRPARLRARRLDRDGRLLQLWKTVAPLGGSRATESS